MEAAIKVATCVFNLRNDSSDQLNLYLEPEGCGFRLPPGKVVEVRLFGQKHPVEMKYSIDGSGVRAVSFWPESGEFELFFDGKSVWEQL